jgi:hypothetical protein
LNASHDSSRLMNRLASYGCGGVTRRPRQADHQLPSEHFGEHVRQDRRAGFLRFVDDVKGDTGPAANAIEEQLAVACFADRAGCHRPDSLHLVGVDDVAEAFESRKRGVGGFCRITPPENVSRPKSTPREACSTTRTDRPAATSAMTSRTALAPMSSTATASGARLSAVMSGDAHRGSHGQVLRHLTAGPLSISTGRAYASSSRTMNSNWRVLR